MLPSEELSRLEALRFYELLDTEPEDTFDIITSMLSEVLGVPHACISLVDRDRVWFKSTSGVEAREVDREPGFCSTLVVSDEEIRHIVDASEHEETRNNSLVCGTPGIRFYAGVPLCTPESLRIGTLCAFGPRPRELSEAEGLTLRNLATLVMHEIELRRTRRQLERTEEALRTAQKLESIGMVASGVAHDFNNLLGGMLGYTELLRLELPDHRPAQELLGELEATGRRAAELVGQVLAYTGRGEESPMVPTDLNAVVRETHHLLASSRKTRSRVELDLDDEIPSVIGQSTGLRQVVMNLISNAGEACELLGGTVRVHTRVEPPGERVLLVVADDGPGLPERDLEKIFEPFFSSKESGRGLGLAICQRIVEQHGGEIDVESAPGKGTTFRISLPACQKTPTQDCDTVAPSVDVTGRGRVLVVDDEPTIREVARRGLHRAGFQVEVAEGGREALEKMSAVGRGFDLVILDWNMPGLGGEQVLETMRRNGSTLPVILSSGHTEEDAREETDRFAIDAFLKKPYRLDELVRAVSSVRER